MKTIGILGGFGPDATLEIEAEILRESRRLLPQRFNQGYPPVVTVHLRHPPILLENGVPPEGPFRVDPRVLETARRLGEWADFLIIGANTPHLFVDEIAAAAGREVLSMVDLVMDDVRRSGPGRVGLLGLGVPGAYVNRFESEGVPFVVPPDDVRGALDEAIYRTLEGATTDRHGRAAHAAVDWLRGHPARPIVMGCTEIPLLLGEAADAPDLINPGRLLARAAVRKAIDDGGS
jgi:aspartate racemase